MNFSQAQRLSRILDQQCYSQMKHGFLKPRILSSDKVACARDMGDYVIMIAFEISAENDEIVKKFIEEHNLEFCWDIWDKREWKVIYTGT